MRKKGRGEVIGVDLVHISSFADQLAQPGSSFLDRAFSVAERLEASRRALSGEAATRYFAGRWAAKEAFIKAWSQALFGQPPVISPDLVDWREISCVGDAWGRVSIQLSGAIDQLFAQTVPVETGDAVPAVAGDADVQSSAGSACAHTTITAVSISHDGDYATAVVQL